MPTSRQSRAPEAPAPHQLGMNCSIQPRAPHPPAGSLHRLFPRLLERYGTQGWWPLLAHAGVNPTKTGVLRGYHPGDYSFPHTARERFEICVGAILTQNTAWPHAERALRNLDTLDALNGPDALLAIPQATLLAAIRPSGYFNAKARKVIALAEFLQTCPTSTPSRPALLSVWGIGPETADSIRLYAFRQPEMVVDTYTRRILAHLGLVENKIGYDNLKAFCVRELDSSVEVYQEFHALMVEHAKRCYARAPYLDWLL